jgi:hypothetical protein
MMCVFIIHMCLPIILTHFLPRGTIHLMINRFRSKLRKASQYLRMLHNFYVVRASGLFDKTWYLDNNPDVAQAKVNPIFHYLRYGGFEGRDPSPHFSSRWYFDTYNDVKSAAMNPLVHYLKFGRKEGRLSFPKPRTKRNCDFFFIIGTGRSGTTLMAQVLNAHSKICVPFELQIAFEYSNNGTRLAEIFNSQKNWSFQAEDYIKLIEERCPHAFEIYYDYRAFFLQCDYPIFSLQWLLTELYTDIAYSQGKSIFAEQTPWYGQNIELLNQIFPQVKFIHMVRDGRDVALSFARTSWWHKDVNLNLERWKQEVNKIETDGLLLAKGRMLTVRYEDFVSMPESVTRKVSDFLGVPFEKTMLDLNHHIDYGQFGKQLSEKSITSSAYQRWQKEKKSAFFSDSVYSWKTNKEVKFNGLSEQVRKTLRRFRYEV